MRGRDLPGAGKLCLLEFAARRFYCQTCACPFREELSWLPRCSRLTQRYREHVFAQCQKTTIQAVHQTERLGYKTVERLYYTMAQHQAQAIQPGGVSKLGIDEFAIKKGHDRFALALSDLETGRVIAVLPDRKKETLEAYLGTWSQAQRAGVQEAAMDLWEPYALAVSACLPNARIVADRFHVMENLNDPVTAARREIQRSLPEETKLTLKGGRWLLVHNEADLSAEDKAKLEAMFGVSELLPAIASFQGRLSCSVPERPDPGGGRPEAGSVDGRRGDEWIEQAVQVRRDAAPPFRACAQLFPPPSDQWEGGRSQQQGEGD